MYYEQLFQTTEAKMNFVKGLIHISKADGVISPEEQTFFIDAARGLGIPEDDIAVLPAVMTQTEEIPLTFASRQEALCFLREALQLCMVDNDYSESEQKEIMKLAKEFGVEPERVYALEKWVQDGIEWKKQGDILVEDSISPPTNFCIASRVLSSSISFGSSIGRSARTLIFSSFIVCLQIKTGQSTRTVLQKVKGSVRRHSPVDNYFFLTIQRFLKNAMP